MFQEYADILICAAVFLAALLYSSVGHGGASGYLAAMAMAGVAPAIMKPAALSLNILVSSIAVVRFSQVRAFSWRIFLPLMVTSVPFSYLGGRLSLSTGIYRPLVGAVLLYAAWQLSRTVSDEKPPAPRPAKWVFPLAGALLGFLSGLTGVGGGIFLSPMLLYFGWASPRVVSGISAAFIFVNSIAGLLGLMSGQVQLPAALPYWALAAFAGGMIGSEYGSRRLTNPLIKKVLVLVLLIAGFKMLVNP